MTNRFILCLYNFVAAIVESGNSFYVNGDKGLISLSVTVCFIYLPCFSLPHKLCHWNGYLTPRQLKGSNLDDY